MLCPHCRMDTRTTDACEWCKKPIAAPQQTATRVRVALTGEVIEETVAMPAPAMAAPVPPVAAPGTAHGPIPPARPSLRSTAELPTHAVTAQMVRNELAQDTYVDPGERWEKSLAIIFPFLALSLLLVHFVPDALPWAAFADCFVTGLALGATGAIPSFDEAFLDCTAVLIVCYLCGPIAGFGAYLLVGMIKQEWNGALLAVLTSHVLIRLLFSFAFQDEAPLWMTVIPYVNVISVWGFISFLSVALSFGGWMMSNFFRPMNE